MMSSDALRTIPTPWAVDDVRSFLSAYGRAPGHLTVHQLHSWWYNTVLLIEADGERLILRRYGVTPPVEVEWELWVLRYLRANGFHWVVQPLLQNETGQKAVGTFLGGPAILYPFVEGRGGCDVEWSVAIDQTAEAVARLHSLTMGLEVPHQRDSSGAEPVRIVRLLTEYLTERGVAPPEPSLWALRTQTEAFVGALQARLAAQGDDLPRGVVHHDAHCANVLFRGERLVALIDFDDAYEGRLVDDIAALVGQWAVDDDDPDRLSLEKALRVVRAYERHRPLTDAERELLPEQLLLFLLADSCEHVRGHLARGADGESAVQTCTTYRRFLALEHDEQWIPTFRWQLRLASG